MVGHRSGCNTRLTSFLYSGLSMDDCAPSQQTLASDPNFSVWVNASAGTGKTKTLIDRILRLLLQGVPPERILCITFTQAAAAQILLRLNETLTQWFTCTDQELSIQLQKLHHGTPLCQPMYALARRLLTEVISCQHGMKIQTIHAFCQSVLREFSLEAQLITLVFHFR